MISVFDIWISVMSDNKEHNKEFDAGRKSWARGVNQWYDLTEDEWAAELGLGRFFFLLLVSYLLTGRL